MWVMKMCASRPRQQAIAAALASAERVSVLTSMVLNLLEFAKLHERFKSPVRAVEWTIHQQAIKIYNAELSPRESKILVGNTQRYMRLQAQIPPKVKFSRTLKST